MLINSLSRFVISGTLLFAEPTEAMDPKSRKTPLESAGGMC